MEEQKCDTVDIYQLPNGEAVMVVQGVGRITERTWIIPIANDAVQIRVSKAPELRDAFAPVVVAPEPDGDTWIAPPRCKFCEEEKVYDKGADTYQCACPGPLEAAELAEYGKPEAPGDVSKKAEKVDTSPERVKKPAKSEHEEQAPPLRCCRECDEQIIKGQCACPEASDEGGKLKPEEQDAGGTVSMGQDEAAEAGEGEKAVWKGITLAAINVGARFTDGEKVREVRDITGKAGEEQTVEWQGVYPDGSRRVGKVHTCPLEEFAAWARQVFVEPEKPAEEPEQKPLPMVVEKGNRFTDRATVREVLKVSQTRHGTYVRSAEVGSAGGVMLETTISQPVDEFVDWVRDRVPTPTAPEHKQEPTGLREPEGEPAAQEKGEEAPEPDQVEDDGEEPAMTQAECDRLPYAAKCPSCNAQVNKCTSFHPTKHWIRAVEYPCKNENCGEMWDYADVVDAVAA